LGDGLPWTKIFKHRHAKPVRPGTNVKAQGLTKFQYNAGGDDNREHDHDCHPAVVHARRAHVVIIYLHGSYFPDRYDFDVVTRYCV
jgi:hypothetical protein